MRCCGGGGLFLLLFFCWDDDDDDEKERGWDCDGISHTLCSATQARSEAGDQGRRAVARRRYTIAYQCVYCYIWS